MKKNFIYLVAALATSTLAFTSCGSDDEQPAVSPKALQQIDVTASLNGTKHAATRADSLLQSTELVDWTTLGIYAFKSEKLDSVEGYAGYKNIAVKEFKAANNKFALTFDKSIYFPFDQSNVDVYLYAPRSAEPTVDEGTMNMTFTVADDQTKNENYIASDFVYGKATAILSNNKGAVDVELKHALSKIIFKVTTDDGLSLAKLSQIKINEVKRSAKINLANDGYITLLKTKDALTVASVDATSDTEMNALVAQVQKGVAAILPPQDMTSTTVSVTLNGKTATASLSEMGNDEGKLEPGKVYTVKLKVKGDKVSVSVLAITDWVSGGQPTEIEISNFQ